MMMYTDADGEDAGWARRARKEDAALAAALAAASAQSRLNVSRYANASSVFRAHSSPPDSNDSTISQI
jgi:hypothetical protein